MDTTKPAIWTPGDWNALFGFGTNILVNLLVLTGLMRFVLHMPDELVFGRILPATGLMLCLSTVYYAWLAYSLAKATGRNDVCALPSGVSVPHMFVVTFVIMLPITIKTGDPIKGWEAGLTWVFIQSFVLMIGGYLGPYIRKVTPRAALLGTLAGVSIAFISLRPALEMFMTPVIGIVCFAIILVSWFGGVRFFKGIPPGLIAIAVGSAIARGSTALGRTTGGPGETGYVLELRLLDTLPAFDHVFSSPRYRCNLVTAIPFGIYNFTEAMNNVESASAAGDNYNLRKVLLADGVGAIVGSMLGSPFPPAVYIGHPGWKAVGGRIGYSLATGVAIAIVCFLGLTALLLAVIPLVAILPILLYIGLVIGAQAFQVTPKSHAPAVVLALIPNIAEWAKTQIDGALAAAGTSAAQLGPAKLAATAFIADSNRSAAARCSPAWFSARSPSSSSTAGCARPPSGRLPARFSRTSG